MPPDPSAGPVDLSIGEVYENTIHEVLDIRFIEATPDRVVLEMDVGPRVHQPFGILHGGASAVIAESAASVGAFMNCKAGEETAVGTDLNISHLRAKSSGTVTATATPIRKGRSMHVWGIDIVDERGQAVAVARCTLAIRPVRPPDSN
ncbi:MAG: 1,4-dihydroxy-2-naphthoyl-CoA hydrolase [Actinomycetota bacterium]|nr:1,4-dihydroxy-2-naphthoyl-CoA hydrolase [Actinomycetota bacterium]